MEKLQFDTRSLAQLIKDLRAAGKPAFPLVYPSLFITNQLPLPSIHGKHVLPLFGLAKKFTTYCNESGQYLEYESDRYGFNNPDYLYDSKKFEVSIVGDSFAQGACVPSNQNISYFLRQKYPETIDLGMGSNGPLLELATLREYGNQLKPKYVLWIYFHGNDLEDLRSEIKNKLLAKYLDRNFSQKLMMNNEKLQAQLVPLMEKTSTEELSQIGFSNEGVLSQATKFFGLRHLITYMRTRFIRKKPGMVDWSEERKRYDFELFQKVLTLAQNNTRSWGGQLVFVYLPHYYEVASRPEENVYVGLEGRNEVLNIVKGLGIPIVDLLPKFMNLNDPLKIFPFRKDNHYNREGYRIVAAEIEEELMQLSKIKGDSNSKIAGTLSKFGKIGLHY